MSGHSLRTRTQLLIRFIKLFLVTSIIIIIIKNSCFTKKIIEFEVGFLKQISHYKPQLLFAIFNFFHIADGTLEELAKIWRRRLDSEPNNAKKRKLKGEQEVCMYFKMLKSWTVYTEDVLPEQKCCYNIEK